MFDSQENTTEKGLVHSHRNYNKKYFKVSFLCSHELIAKDSITNLLQAFCFHKYLKCYDMMYLLFFLIDLRVQKLEWFNTLSGDFPATSVTINTIIFNGLNIERSNELI